MQGNDCLLFNIDVPCKRVNGSIQFSFSYQEFMEKYPDITQCHYYEPEEKDFDKGVWDFLCEVRKEQVELMNSSIKKELAAHGRGAYETNKPPALWTDKDWEDSNKAQGQAVFL